LLYFLVGQRLTLIFFYISFVHLFLLINALQKQQVGIIRQSMTPILTEIMPHP